MAYVHSSVVSDQYTSAAVRTKAAGFDMVELHGGTSYLMAQFLPHGPINVTMDTAEAWKIGEVCH